ncbi:MAG TPA: winged helix-turn-helix transcriptional regulator [Peptococcaceae bacterium]|nr:winged helix-turn-helix transcriptional regulator [Peptococcaceae bacterium]
MNTDNRYQNNARVFKALCDPNRLRIIEMLQSGERCACEILEDLQIGQSTLSHHMKILCDSRLVDSRREGKWMYYSLNKAGCEAAKKLLDEITSQKENSYSGGRECECL